MVFSRVICVVRQDSMLEIACYSSALYLTHASTSCANPNFWADTGLNCY